jgi:hypothetical protein
LFEEVICVKESEEHEADSERMRREKSELVCFFTWWCQKIFKEVFKVKQELCQKSSEEGWKYEEHILKVLKC